MSLILIPSDDKDICDYEERDALIWKQSTPESQRDELDGTNNASFGDPDRIWIIPPRFILSKINKELIEKRTNTYITCNKNDSRIEIYGDPQDSEEAYYQLENLSRNLSILKQESIEKVKKARKAKQDPTTNEPGWGKPDKELSKKKLEREARKRKDDKYKEKPKDLQKFPYNDIFMIPNTSDIDVSQILGENNEKLNPIRIDTKCYIWYEDKQDSIKLINIVGDYKVAVDTASTRVKNLFIKSIASRSLAGRGIMLHLIERPYKPYKIRITDPPPQFYLPFDEIFPNKYKLLEAVEDGGNIPTVGGEGKSQPNFDINKVQRNRNLNMKNIRESLLEALQSIHLFDGEIKMRIRFGRMYLITNIDFDRNMLKPIEEITKRILSKSKFATCLAKKEQQLKNLLSFLAVDNRELDDSPFREFKIRAYKILDGSDDESCMFDIQFTKNIIKERNGRSDIRYEGKIDLWNATIRQKTLLDINMMGLENDDYSWKLNIQTAIRISNDMFCPQGKFVTGLRISQQDGRLVYSNTNEIKVVSVCEKTKWKYWWKDDYLIEVTKYEYWRLTHHMKKKGIEILLDKEKPEVSYGVTLYRRSWDGEFALNNCLGPGEAPEWHPQDMIDQEENLFNDIQDFLKNVLQVKLPMPNSLKENF